MDKSLIQWIFPVLRMHYDLKYYSIIPVGAYIPLAQLDSTRIVIHLKYFYLLNVSWSHPKEGIYLEKVVARVVRVAGVVAHAFARYQVYG